ncbi:hypothetical protein TRIUR3_05504 [Triticum urartu]|uniref:Nucleolar pre-ribosomal-associated protein 1 n=1 Tax=Triticum urartu TaxID=4572 RepID=M7YU20_TRIUA|nr:hypothetical protein TRIUR3_05504 [Triticum urartu]
MEEPFRFLLCRVDDRRDQCQPRPRCPSGGLGPDGIGGRVAWRPFLANELLVETTGTKVGPLHNGDGMVESPGRGALAAALAKVSLGYHSSLTSFPSRRRQRRESRESVTTTPDELEEELKKEHGGERQEEHNVNDHDKGRGLDLLHEREQPSSPGERAESFPRQMEWLGAASASSGEQTKRVGEPKREQNLVKVGMDTWNQSFGASYKIRLVHILKNLHTSEVKIYSDASREFIELLDGDSGGEVLRDYVQQSPRLVELMEAWRLHREKPGMAYILSLFATVLGNPGGKSRQHAFSKKCLDAVARTILEDKDKVGDVYRELNSGEFRRQNAALDLLAAIVRRGAGLASEVAESFDFKMAVVTQLAGIQKKRGGRDGRNQKKGANFGSTRRSLVGFAMSFLEVGNPKLLRWVLQQRELYSGVLRGIGEDDAETVVYVLSTLRDNVLVEESLVPPGLRSVLFGSATLEQLSLISGNLDAGEAADLAHQVLVMVCTDPKNGLMPSSHLRGNEKRLLDLMKKLKSTESVHHKNLLLAIVSKRLSFCAAYMNEFPYNIEPRPSPSWFAAISLAADIISSAKTDSIFHSFLSHDLVSVDDEQVQVVLKCIVPHVCSRAVINRGLQHSDDLVKHGSLRLVFESVNLLCCVTEAINGVVSSVGSTSESSSSTKGKIRMNSFPGLSCSTATDAFLVDKLNQGDQMRVKRWISLREYIQDEVRGAIPDPQVLLKLLSSASQKHQNYSQSRLERRALVSEPPQKKQRCNAIDEDDDIIIGGIDVEWAKDVSEEQDQDLASDHATTLCEIWGLDKQDLEMKDAEVVDSVFHSKLLDVLRLYLRVMPSSFDGSFDFFRVIPPNPLDLSKDEQHSLLSLLVEYSGQHEGHWDPERVPESMYKHLQPLIDIMLHSPVKIIREQAYILVKAALASSGAYDQNFAEIDAWLLFLPGYEAKWSVRESLGVGVSNKLSQIVIPFLCDAVSMVGSNLYKYQDYMRKFISKSGQLEVYSPAFSPLVICVLQKCLRLLDSESGAPQDIICSFPELLDVVKTHCPSHMQFLSSVLYLQHDYLAEIATCWPDIFFCSLRQIEGNLDVDEGKCQNHSISAELTALSTFLNVTPFCALLPSVLSLVFSGPAKTGEAHALLLDALVRLIRAKLYESIISELTFNLRVILFWSHRLLLSYTRKGSNVLEELCHVCSTLVDSIFERIRVLAADTADLNASAECFQDIVESVLHHPTIDLPCSLSNCPDLTDGSAEHVEEAFTSFSKENLHLVDGFVVNLLSKLYDLLLLAENDGQSLESLFASPKAMLGKILLLFKDKFQVCMDNGNFGLLLPNFYMVRALKKFMSPVRLLELVNWMFSELESRGSSCSAAFAPAAFVCLSIADIAMELLYDYLQQTDQRSESCQLWGLEIRSSDIATIQRVYHFILHFTAKLNLESADVCLLKMLIRIHNAERSAGQNTEYTAFHMMLSTMAINTPLSILHHCMFPTSKVKAKVLRLLLEVSPIHMNFFGQMLMKVLEEDTSILQGMDYNSDSSWAHADSSILLLPAALSYMRHHSDGHMQCAEFLEPLAKFYCEMLLGDNGFPCWKSFITRTIFEENFGDFQHESVPDMMDYFSDTLLGKSVTMLHYCLSLKEMPRKQRLEIVASLCPQSSGLLDFDVNDINPDSHKGSLLQPAPGILKSVDSLFTKENEFHICIAEKRKIEIIRLLRILYDIKSRQQSNGLLNESKELSFLLLSVYGATLSETDLEIFNLMNEIESHECKTIAEMDHLWGSAAVKYREELKLDSSISEIHKTENTESNSRRRALFRENIPIDSKLCVMTVLQFCYKRSSRTSVFSLEQLRQDKFDDILKIYDPMFILRFSIHTLLMGYIEPAEFSRVGLLAITLVCISSPDEELRKLGYESLNTFKKSLEASQKSKEKWQLQLLLTYLQNGISKPWQRIPSIIAIFAAEASLTLLDSSHTQFNTISKFLMNSACVDMQSIPLFPTLLKSSSVHFKADRLWMLRLLYAGSNLADDATICKNKSVLELALAFCSSAISDSESKYLILQVLKKCVKLPVLAQHLVKNCGLLSWISSVISTQDKGLDNNSSSRIVGLALECRNELRQLPLKILCYVGHNLPVEGRASRAKPSCKILSSFTAHEKCRSTVERYGDRSTEQNESAACLVSRGSLLVLDVLILSRFITEWLQETALEQLSEISQYLYLLVEDGKILKGDFTMLSSVLNIIASTMRLSMKRKIYQPHFTLSLHGIFKLCQAIDGNSRSIELKLSMELGTDVVLMNGPLPILSETDKSRAVMVVSWVTSNIFWLCKQKSAVEMSCEEPLNNECLLSKILRWLVASVILGRISRISPEKRGGLATSTNSPGTLQSFLNHSSETVEMVDSHVADEALAAIILYLQGHVKKKSDTLPSVVTALSLLLLDRCREQVLVDGRGQIETLCSKIHCPAESNPAWRWHYYQPWRDPALQHTATERMEVEQSCRSLLIMFSNALSAAGLPAGVSVLSVGDIEKSGLFQWERDSVVEQPHA